MLRPAGSQDSRSSSSSPWRGGDSGTQRLKRPPRQRSGRSGGRSAPGRGRGQASAGPGGRPEAAMFPQPAPRRGPPRSARSARTPGLPPTAADALRSLRALLRSRAAPRVGGPLGGGGWQEAKRGLIHSSNVHNSQTEEGATMSVDGRMDKEDAVHVYVEYCSALRREDTRHLLRRGCTWRVLC